MSSHISTINLGKDEVEEGGGEQQARRQRSKKGRRVGQSRNGVLEYQVAGICGRSCFQTRGRGPEPGQKGPPSFHTFQRKPSATDVGRRIARDGWADACTSRPAGIFRFHLFLFTLPLPCVATKLASLPAVNTRQTNIGLLS